MINHHLFFIIPIIVIIFSIPIVIIGYEYPPNHYFDLDGVLGYYDMERYHDVINTDNNYIELIMFVPILNEAYATTCNTEQMEWWEICESDHNSTRTYFSSLILFFIFVAIFPVSIATVIGIIYRRKRK